MVGCASSAKLPLARKSGFALSFRREIRSITFAQILLSVALASDYSLDGKAIGGRR